METGHAGEFGGVWKSAWRLALKTRQPNSFSPVHMRHSIPHRAETGAKSFQKSIVTHLFCRLQLPQFGPGIVLVELGRLCGFHCVPWQRAVPEIIRWWKATTG